MVRRTRRSASPSRRLAVAAGCLAALAAGAPARALDARPSVAASRAADPIKVDGALDEPAWASATPITAFRLLLPREGEAPDESTAVRVLVEDQRIVFGIWCSTRRPLRASLTPRDQILDGDHIAIHLDTRGDGQTAYIFGVNPYGVELDGILITDPDFKWDGVWDAAAKREPGAWTAEIAVPFRTMRFPGGPAHPWRLWIRREITAWNEVASWPLYRQGEAGRIMLQAADLTGLDGVRSGRELTVEPYVFGSLNGTRAPLSSGDLGAWSRDDQSQGGADVQAGIGSSLALNATYRPDFSQIEADALQIDLNRRFPLEYPEKRPFFLEGWDKFATPLDLIYTRRMSDPDWGGKLTGRIGRVDTGALFLRDNGGASLAGTGFGPAVDSTPGYFGLARASLPFGDGSNAGFLAGVHAQDAVSAIPGDPAFHADGTLSHFEGLDSQLKLTRRWTLETQLAATATRDDSARAGDATLRESFDDWTGYVKVRYQDAARIFRASTRYVGPKFRDELGYQERVGVIYRQLNLDWNLYPRAGLWQRVTPVMDALFIHDHTGRPDYIDVSPNLELQFRSNLFWLFGCDEIVEHWLSRNYEQQRPFLYFEDTRWRPLTWNLEAHVGDGIYYGATDAESFLAWTETYIGSLTLRPSPRVSSTASVSYLRVARRPGAGDVLSETLTGINTTAQFTRELSARFYPQYDSHSKHLALNGLIGYVLHPGTVLYLGVNSGFDRISGRQQPTAREFFAKASYQFAL